MTDNVTHISQNIPMLLWCPACGERHIDSEDRPAHKTHACQGCGMVWMPALVHTRGVQFLPGCKDEEEEEDVYEG